MKKIATLTMVALLLLGMFAFNVSAQENVSVYIDGTKIECLFESPFKDPKAYLIRGTIIAIRDCDANGIAITKEVNQC